MKTKILCVAWILLLFGVLLTGGYVDYICGGIQKQWYGLAATFAWVLLIVGCVIGLSINITKIVYGD